MSGLMKGLQKVFTKDRVMILGVFILLAMFLLYYSTGKTTVMDSMDVGMSMGSDSSMGGSVSPPHNIVHSTTEGLSSQSSQGYAVHEVANPSELLPKDAHSQWASLNPSSQNSPQTPDLLQAGYHIGLDTVGQTMKNPNLQLRSDPIINKTDVGPWNNSTVEPDLLRQPLEVGQGPR
jgi:hypothetical protein